MPIFLFLPLLVVAILLTAWITATWTIKNFPEIAARMTPQQRLEFNERVRKATNELDGSAS